MIRPCLKSPVGDAESLLQLCIKQRLKGAAMSSDTPLHAALALHVRRASTAELAETLELLSIALTRRLGEHRSSSDCLLAFRILQRALRASEPAQRPQEAPTAVPEA